MTSARRAALDAFEAYNQDFEAENDDSLDSDERDAFIAGYLRARADALKAEIGRVEAVERLMSLVERKERIR